MISLILVIYKIRCPLISYLSIRNNLMDKILYLHKPIQNNKGLFVHSQLCLGKQLALYNYKFITHVCIIEIRYLIHLNQIQKNNSNIELKT